MSARDPKQWVRLFGNSFKQCSPEVVIKLLMTDNGQVTAYGACIMGHMEQTQQGSCDKQWVALKQCLGGTVRCIQPRQLLTNTIR